MLTQEDYWMIQELHQQGVYRGDIAERLGVHRKTVGRALERGGPPSKPRGQAQALRDNNPLIYPPDQGVLRANKARPAARAQGFGENSNWGQVIVPIGAAGLPRESILPSACWATRGASMSWRRLAVSTGDRLVRRRHPAGMGRQPQGSRDRTRARRRALQRTLQARPAITASCRRPAVPTGHAPKARWSVWWATSSNTSSSATGTSRAGRIWATGGVAVLHGTVKDPSSASDRPSCYSPHRDTSYVETRHVGWDAYVNVRGNRYSVPSAYCGQMVTIRLSLDDELGLRGRALYRAAPAGGARGGLADGCRSSPSPVGRGAGRGSLVARLRGGGPCQRWIASSRP